MFKTGTVFNIQKFCIHDGDGIRTCVFLKGCPLNCIWCHNPESLDKKPSLSFSKQKCSSCGRCIDFCAVRKIENGVLKIALSVVNVLNRVLMMQMKLSVKR